MLNSIPDDNLGGYKLTTVDGKIAFYKESEGADSATPFSHKVTMKYKYTWGNGDKIKTFITLTMYRDGVQITTKEIRFSDYTEGSTYTAFNSDI